MAPLPAPREVQRLGAELAHDGVGSAGHCPTEAGDGPAAYANDPLAVGFGVRIEPTVAGVDAVEDVWRRVARESRLSRAGRHKAITVRESSKPLGAHNLIEFAIQLTLLAQGVLDDPVSTRARL